MSSALCETPPPADLCFDGPADYTYSDDQLWINIQKRTLTDPVLVTYFVCDVQVASPDVFKTALSGDEPFGIREPTADIAERHGATLAVNGDCYSFNATSIIIRNGQLLRSKRLSGRHLLVMHADGHLSVITDLGSKNSDVVSEELLAEGVAQTWAFGPELVHNSEPVWYKDFALVHVFNGIREPRTGIGELAPLHYVIVVADGRSEGYSEGMNLLELQKVFLDMGAKTAFNLDGGGSTTLYFRGEVLNKPSGGGSRYVSDIIYF